MTIYLFGLVIMLFACIAYNEEVMKEGEIPWWIIALFTIFWPFILGIGLGLALAERDNKRENSG